MDQYSSLFCNTSEILGNIAFIELQSNACTCHTTVIMSGYIRKISRDLPE